MTKTSSRTKSRPMPIPEASRSNGGGRGHSRTDAQDDVVSAAATILDGDQVENDAQTGFVAEEQAPAENGRGESDNHAAAADPAGALLLILADELDDLERARIAAENRLRSLTTVKGLASTDVAAFEGAGVVDGLQAIEDHVTKQLEKAMKAHPLGPWVQRTKGIGLKQAGRMFATIGDPLYNATERRSRRGPAELWQFAGHGDPERSRLRKGQQVQFSPKAKMRVHLCAEAAVKAGVRKVDGCDDTDGYDLEHRTAISPLGARYLAARESWAARETSDGHRHNHALRVVGKTILKDLYNVARAFDQEDADTQAPCVGGV